MGAGLMGIAALNPSYGLGVGASLLAIANVRIASKLAPTGDDFSPSWWPAIPGGHPAGRRCATL